MLALGGTRDRLTEIPELRAHFLRVTRADIAVLDTYQPTPVRAVTAFAGTSDVWAPPTTMRPVGPRGAQRLSLRQFEQRQVPEALQERISGSLELFAFRFGGRGPPLVATNLIDRILDEALDMDAVEDRFAASGVRPRIGVSETTFVETRIP